MKVIEKISAFVGRFMALIVLAVAGLALFVPPSSLWIDTSWVNYLLMIVMFGMGLTMKPRDFSLVFRRPKDILFGGAALCAAGLVCGGRLNMTSGQGVLILLWLAFVSAAAFTVWTALLRIHPASKISVFNLLVPIFGTVLSGLLLGENILKIETLLSLLLIAAGILLVNFSKGGKKHDKSGHFGYGRRDARQ